MTDRVTKLSLFGWISILICSMSDDLVSLNCLATKSLLAKQAQASLTDLYTTNIIYSTGFLLGTATWNLVAKCLSARLMLLVSQIALIILMILLLYVTNIFQIAIIRLLQGVVTSGIIICLTPLLKKTLSSTEFSRFITLNSATIYTLEAAIPLLMYYLNKQFPQYSMILGIFIFIFTFTLYNLFINFEDTFPKKTITKAAREVYTGYLKIIQSPLVLLLIISGITEGLTDTLLDLMEVVIGNIWPTLPSHTSILNLSIISVSLFAFVHISSYFGAIIKPTNKIFNWNVDLISTDINLILKITDATFYLLLISCLFSKWTNYLLFILCMILMLGSLAVTNYYMVRLLYSIYSNAEYVVSTLAILDNLAVVLIKFISSFVQNSKNTHSIFIYCAIYFLIIKYLLLFFMKTVRAQESIDK